MGASATSASAGAWGPCLKGFFLCRDPGPRDEGLISPVPPRWGGYRNSLSTLSLAYGLTTLLNSGRGMGSGFPANPGQFGNADNIAAHYRTTGPEIWEQCGGLLGAFIAAQGSGGTLTGVGRYLRERDDRIRLYAVEPDECALLARRAWGPHGIEGIGDGFIPDNLYVSLLAGVISTTTSVCLSLSNSLWCEIRSFYAESAAAP